VSQEISRLYGLGPEPFRDGAPITNSRLPLTGNLEGSMAGAIGHGKFHIRYAGSVPELALRVRWILWVLVPSAVLLKF